MTKQEVLQKYNIPPDLLDKYADKKSVQVIATKTSKASA